MRAISSRHNPVVAMYRDAARGERDGRLLLDGVHLLRDAIDAGLAIEHTLVASESASDPEFQRLLARLDGARVDCATAMVMGAASPVRSPSPIVALARQPARARDLFTDADAFVIVACDIQDPGNLGAIARVAEAAGGTGLVTAGQGADAYGWKALRGSMGSLLRLPTDTAASAEIAMRAARDSGCRVVAASPRGGRTLFEADLGGRLAVFIGGEGGGLPAAVERDADERITIPMTPPVESLNAAVTAALVAYEIRRRR